MALLDDDERLAAEAIAALASGNPFLPERITNERIALGEAFTESSPVWSINVRAGASNPNLVALRERTEALTEKMRSQLRAGESANAEDARRYEDLVTYALYTRYEEPLYLATTVARSATTRSLAYPHFCEDVAHFRDVPIRLPDAIPASRLFALFFQIRRAFHHIFHSIVGASMPVAKLRAAVWQSVFTHDLRRYARALHEIMGDFTTLITGPSGTGKELVARGIGLSRYIPFDEKTERFAEDFADSFHPLNLSALSPTLIESELFGHRRGAFTGAIADRAGWLETCRPRGTIFLDEIGELDGSLQVKLLRVLQTRRFERIGDTETRRFQGKVIAATNRNLEQEIRAGRFREDFFYRLNSDLVRTPSLRDQLLDRPEDLPEIVGFLAGRIVGNVEGPALAREVVAWVEERLGPHYPWPGNVRELEQCVRNVLVRSEYRPTRTQGLGPRAEIAEAFSSGQLTIEELTDRYCTIVYADSGSYLEAARRLGIDRRTVKARVDRELLERLRSG